MSEIHVVKPHRAHIEEVVSAAELLASDVAARAAELSADGCQPHLIAALTAFESGLRRECLRLASADGDLSQDQQALAL